MDKEATFHLDWNYVYLCTLEEVSLIFFKKAFNNCKYIYTQEVINESLTIPLTHCVLQAMNHVFHVYESRVIG